MDESVEFGDVRLPERFWAKVQQYECWIWQSETVDGYGRFRWGAKHAAHRLTAALRYGELPLGMVCDHLCRVRACVNPAHIELVTSAENTARGLVPNGDLCRNGIHPWPDSKESNYSKPPKYRCGPCYRAARSKRNKQRRADATAALRSLGLVT